MYKFIDIASITSGTRINYNIVSETANHLRFKFLADVTQRIIADMALGSHL